MMKDNHFSHGKLMEYFSVYMSDRDLNVWHLAILSAVLNLGYLQGKSKRIVVSRSIIMNLSHVNTLPTYHKYFKQLQLYGYIKYKPSYHPLVKSEIKLYKKRVSSSE